MRLAYVPEKQELNLVHSLLILNVIHKWEAWDKKENTKKLIICMISFFFLNLILASNILYIQWSTIKHIAPYSYSSLSSSLHIFMLIVLLSLFLFLLFDFSIIRKAFFYISACIIICISPVVSFVHIRKGSGISMLITYMFTNLSITLIQCITSL